MLETAHFHMINVGKKTPTFRLAVASGTILVGEKTFFLIKNRQLPKGDPLILAEIAGIQGAKKTAELIPLCHPLPLDHIEVVLQLDEVHYAIVATAFVSTTSKTGVEMEAISAVNAALLTIYDLSKMMEPHLIISNIQLLLKKGGKSGLWLSPSGVPEWICKKACLDEQPHLTDLKSAIISLSDRAFKGIYEDRSGQYLCNTLTSMGSEVVDYQLLPDDEKSLQEKILSIVSELKPDFIFTTGGTGIGPRDITPESVLAISDKKLPGVGELLRMYGSQSTPYSWISRSCAMTIKNTLVICFPGSENGVKEGLACLAPILGHFIKMLHGEQHDKL